MMFNSPNRLSQWIPGLRTIILIFVSWVSFLGNTAAGAMAAAESWPQFGLVFQEIKDYNKASQRFQFAWHTHGKIEKLLAGNKKGIYVRYYNLTMANPDPGFNKIYLPDYEYITNNHPEWLLRNKDGSVARWYGDKKFLHLAIDDPDYLDWVLAWLKQGDFSGKVFKGHLGLDYGMFMYPDPKWARYENPESYRAGWEFSLKKIAAAFHPDYKVILNTGSCDLDNFVRMVQHIDGVLVEGLSYSPNNKKFRTKAERDLLLDRLAMGRWCAKQGKIWAVKYDGTTKALTFGEISDEVPRFISIGDREVIITDSSQNVIQKFDLSQPGNNTIGKLAESLKKIKLEVASLSPYPETKTLGTLQPVKLLKISNNLIIKFKAAPREAFLFGYAAILLAAGPHSYYIFRDENLREYYYPEMDWPVGAPQGEMSQVAADVFRREFAAATVYLNLSEKPFYLANKKLVLPFRAALIRKTPLQ